LQRTRMYASFLGIARALHLDVFEQPEENHFFNNLLGHIHHPSTLMGDLALQSVSQHLNLSCGGERFLW